MPPGVLTAILTGPTAPGGAMAVSVVAEVTETAGDAVAPKVTVAPGTKPVPITATMVAPSIEPTEGETELTLGAP